MKTSSLLSILSMSLLLFGITKATFADPPLPTPVGRVVWIKGDSLKAIMPNKEERLLQKQSVINENDLLMTNDTTTAEVVFTDNTLITFQPNTKFSIEKYNYTAKKKDNSVGKSVMKLVEGGFRTITGLIAKTNSSDYQVQTPIATIGVRGTDYAVYIKNGEVFLGYYSGKPCIKSNNKPNELCLDGNSPYAKVSSIDVAPQVLTQRPEGFSQKLDIVPATISMFTSSVPVATPRSGAALPARGGSTSSFCIQ